MEQKEPLVSVVMPVFNGSSTIRLALSSLVYQDYENWECIVVNDGSTDDTINVIKSFGDSRIKLINLDKNRGRGFARDIAIKNCKGKYLCYLDADDFLHHKKIHEQVQVLECNPDIDLVGCSRIQFNDELVPLMISEQKDTSKVLYKDGNPLPLVMPSVMIRREKSKLYNYDRRLDVGEDFDYISRYLDGAFYININEPLYFYRLANLSRKKLLYYAKEDIRRGAVLYERNKTFGLKVIVLQTIKLIVYFFVTLFLEPSYFLNKRDMPLLKVDIEMFNDELKLLKSKINHRG